MATRDKYGQVTETTTEATQSENSKDSFYILKVSIVLAVIAGIALYWYFGIFSGPDSSLPVKPL